MHPKENYNPSDLASQLSNTTPKQELNSIPAGIPSPLTLDNLDQLNSIGGKNGTNIYLTSNDDISKTPTWSRGVIPDADGKTQGATSCAVIVVDKGSGEVDAFYMFFYAYNDGGKILEQNMGNHIGDW